MPSVILVITVTAFPRLALGTSCAGMVAFCPARGDSRFTANQSRLRVLAALGDALIVPLNGDSHEQRFQSQRLAPVFAEPDRDVEWLFPSRMAKRIGAMEQRRGEDGLRFGNLKSKHARRQLEYPHRRTQ